MVLEILSFDIPAKNEITALVPDKKRLIKITIYPYFKNHFLGFSNASFEINENLLDSIILVPNCQPIQYINVKPIEEPMVVNIRVEIRSTFPKPINAPIKTTIESQGAGGNIFSRNVINSPNNNIAITGSVASDKNLIASSSILNSFIKQHIYAN